MKLQILVPQYKETDDVIKGLLDSIEVQQNVNLKEDVGVIICNDGSDTFLSHDLFKRYSFPIEYHKEPHRGVSATRNACLDYATADYVCFCDADDIFYNACGFYIIFREFELGGFDALMSAFIEESRDPVTKDPVYITHQQDSTFVHGKIYRRKYLLKEGIRFNPALTIHEDSYFNFLAQHCAKQFKYCQTPFYLWRWRDESVCRHDPKYILKTYNCMLDSNTALVNEFKRRGKKDDAMFCATQMIYDAYYTMNKKEWIDQENKDYRAATEKRFKQYYTDFRDLFESIDDQVKKQIIVGVKNRMFTEGLFMESITFDDWIKWVLKTY